MLTLIRCVVCQQIYWFASLDIKIVTIIVNISALVITTVLVIITHINVLAKGQFPGITLYLSDDLTVSNTATITRPPYAIFTLISASMMTELYIGIKIKKLPCTRFIPVTMGHIFMIACIQLIINFHKSSPNKDSVLPSFIVISLQLLYTYKVKNYVIEVTRKWFNNLTTNSVTPLNDNHDLNDIGIFIGCQIPTISSRIQEQDISIQNYSSVEFGDSERDFLLQSEKMILGRNNFWPPI